MACVANSRKIEVRRDAPASDLHSPDKYLATRYLDRVSDQAFDNV